MKKTEVYAVRYNYRTHALRKTLLGNVILSDVNTISARRYNELKRAALRIPRDRHEVLHLVTSDGKMDTFGGYPADTNVRFE